MCQAEKEKQEYEKEKFALISSLNQLKLDNNQVAIEKKRILKQNEELKSQKTFLETKCKSFVDTIKAQKRSLTLILKEISSFQDSLCEDQVRTLTLFRQSLHQLAIQEEQTFQELPLFKFEELQSNILKIYSSLPKINTLDFIEDMKKRWRTHKEETFRQK